MQVIITKFHGATNSRGSRISATSSGEGSRVYIHYPHEVGVDEAHSRAAAKLAAKLGWHGRYVQGSFHDGRQVFVPIFESNTVCL